MNDPKISQVTFLQLDLGPSLCDLGRVKIIMDDPWERKQTSPNALRKFSDFRKNILHPGNYRQQGPSFGDGVTILGLVWISKMNIVIPDICVLQLLFPCYCSCTLSTAPACLRSIIDNVRFECNKKNKTRHESKIQKKFYFPSAMLAGRRTSEDQFNSQREKQQVWFTPSASFTARRGRGEVLDWI